MIRNHLYGLALLPAMLVSCKKDDDKKSGNSANIPHVKPPVQEAAPSGLQTGLVSTAVQGLSERFFNADGGPSNIFNLLTNIDKAIDDLNSITGSEEKSCQSQAPVEYSISPGGETVSMFAQCYQSLAAGAVSTVAGFNQFGIKDGTVYLYSYNGGNQNAVIVSPIAGKVGKYNVKAWFTVGATSSNVEQGSYGIMNLSANSDTKTFEFTVAGLGLGYCGAQLKSDAIDIFAQTSTDMASTCNSIESVCAKASDITDSTSCSDEIKNFELTALGRKEVVGPTKTFAASQYPTVPNLTFDATSSDALHFGPTTATVGVGTLDSAGK